MNTNREQQFDQLMQSKLEAYSEAPDMELMQPIRMRARRVMSLYHIARILMLVAMAGAGLYGFLHWNNQFNLPQSGALTPSTQIAVSHSSTGAQLENEATSTSNVRSIPSLKPSKDINPQRVRQGINKLNLTGRNANSEELKTNKDSKVSYKTDNALRPQNASIKSEDSPLSNPKIPAKDNCQIAFTYYTGYQGEKVFSPIANGSGNLNYEWKFGDGTVSTQATPEHHYTSNGSYPVQLTMKDAKGCTVQHTEWVQVSLPNQREQSIPNSIRGVVRAGADPVALTRVLLIPAANDNNQKDLLQTVTNGQGEFEFKHIGQGYYYIQAMTTSYLPEYSAAYWGNTSQAADAPQVLFMAENGESLAGYSIDLIYSGQLKTGETALGGTEVFLLDQDNKVVGRGTIDANGNVKVNGQLTGNYKVMDPKTGNINGDVNLGGGDVGQSGGVIKGSVKNENTLSLTPNPATNSVNVGLQTSGSEQTTVIVLDQNGKEMMRNTVTMTTGTNQVPIDISPLPGGVYYVVVIKADGSLTSSRLVKNDLSGR